MEGGGVGNGGAAVPGLLLLLLLLAAETPQPLVKSYGPSGHQEWNTLHSCVCAFLVFVLLPLLWRCVRGRVVSWSAMLVEAS